MKSLFLALPIIAMSAGLASAEMRAQIGAPWNGKTVPAGQQCTLHGGKGKTPPFQVSGIPDGTVMLVVEYNDKSFRPLSTKGGHGTLGYPVKGSAGSFAAVPGLTAKLPGGVRVIKKARSTGEYASAGYLPPCSGGKGNQYQAEIKAINAQGKVLAKTKMDLGRY
ncbi:hypothetical protein [uncultured Pseudosulfitobacter sp.]|uniref:hypothetical protein n=1 Tax=uncultured Pseudosulfitobacter sp. TaxID=2854214 RepID=UPI0030DA8658|tara:strand:- start:418 stop:912 length:495 start_codon:yes stop_codon:yes gene_type:complete